MTREEWIRSFLARLRKSILIYVIAMKANHETFDASLKDTRTTVTSDHKRGFRYT